MGVVYSFTGSHTSGKSTLGQAMHERGFSYYPETAQELIDRGEAPWITGSGISGPEFQRQIFHLEQQRELAYLTRGEPVIVETYHLGNLAHCDLQGAAEVAVKTREHIQLLLEHHSIRGVHFEVDPTKIPERSQQFPDGMTHEQLDFYTRLCPAIRAVYREFSIPVVVIQTNGSLERAIKQTKEALDWHKKHA